MNLMHLSYLTYLTFLNYLKFVFRVLHLALLSDNFAGWVRMRRTLPVIFCDYI